MYKKNKGDAYVLASNVIDASGASLSATQTDCTFAIYDITAASTKTSKTITLTYNADGNYTFPLSSIDSEMIRGHAYTGTISHSGMLDINTAWVIDPQDQLTTVDLTDIQNTIIQYGDTKWSASLAKVAANPPVSIGPSTRRSPGVIKRGP